MSDFAPIPARIGHPLYAKRTSSLPLLPITKKKENVVTIAISGCTSSGKTTLTVLLAEIFSTVEKSNKPTILLNDSPVKLDLKGFFEDDENLMKNGNKYNDNEANSVQKRGPIIIYQDAYFKDKSYCPTISFTSTPADADFTRRSLSDDFIKQYAISWGGCNTIGRVTHSTEGGNYTSSVIEQVPPFWYIIGPDTDCWNSLDIPALAGATQHARETGELSDASRQLEKITAIYNPGLLVTEAQRDAILYVYADLIMEMREVIKVWSKSHSAAANAEYRFEGHIANGAVRAGDGKKVVPPALCFIEGFLLFPSPQSASPTISQRVSQNNENKMPTSSLLVQDDGFRPEKRNSAILIAEARKAAFQDRNAKARAKIMENFDIKLFLPTSKAKAKQRRFMRDIYIDSPHGKRYPGQMWKSEGYFDNITWGNYVKEHDWLFKGGLVDHAGDDEHAGAAEHVGGMDLIGAADQGGIAMEDDGKKCVGSSEAEKHGVHIRPGLDAGVEETVSWAVQVILQELENKDRITSCSPDLPETATESHYDADDEGSETMDNGNKGKKSLGENICGWKGCFCF
jgi:hypothetical protein